MDVTHHLVPTKAKTLLGEGTYGQVIICPGGACKSFVSREIFFHESALSLYLTGLPNIVEVKEIDCPNKMIRMARYQDNLHRWTGKNPYVSGDNKSEIRFNLILNILSGLNSLHQLGLLHGDIKPANILVTDNRAVLADFGNTGSPLYISLRLMTKFYAPPDEETTLSADIYALGIIILEMWKPFRSYRVPFKNYELRLRIKLSPLPIELKRIVLLCVDILPKNRPMAKDIYHQLTGFKLFCHLPVISMKKSLYGIDSEILCKIMKIMRDHARHFGLSSPERTLGLFHYWIGVRKINPDDYLSYAMAILYLYDQIIRPGRSGNIKAYFGPNESKQLKGKRRVCQLLKEKRGLQILIQGY